MKLCKKFIFGFIIGILIGCLATMLAIKSNKGEQSLGEKLEPAIETDVVEEAPIVDDTANVDDTAIVEEKAELKIEPLFADDLKKIQEYRSYYDALLSCGKLYRTSDMYFLADTCVFFGEVELFFLANNHLKSLPDDQKAAFVNDYKKWLAEFEYKNEQPFLDSDGVPYEGTMVIPMNPGRRDDLIQEYLKTFPNRPILEERDHYIKEDFNYLGD